VPPAQVAAEAAAEEQGERIQGRHHTALALKLAAVAACLAWAVRSQEASGTLALAHHACCAWVVRGWAVHTTAEPARQSELALAASRGASFPSATACHAVGVGTAGRIRDGGAQVRVLVSSAEAPFPPAEETRAE
jgi:hypothetical protein